MSNDSKDELTLRIGEKLTAARIESGYTQSRAARAVGTSQSCISAVEHGKKQNVNIIIALIKLYGASYEDVFGLVKVREKLCVRLSGRGKRAAEGDYKRQRHKGS